MNDFVYGAIIGITSVLIALIWLSRIDRGLRQMTPQNEGQLVIAPGYKRFTIAFVALGTISIFAIVTRESSSNFEDPVFYLFAVFAFVIISRMSYDTFVLETRFDEAGIYTVNRFLGEQKICWSEITGITFDTTFNVFVIKSPSHKVRLSKYSIGIDSALKYLMEKAPNSSTHALGQYLAQQAD
tara:strand:- start:202 stop:753 length:552 start_codon:yes stop_codon:yes gene_type:complete